MTDLATAVVAILNTPDAIGKAQRCAAVTAARAAHTPLGHTPPPDRPARPARPVLLPPRDMPRRRTGQTPEARIALLHALAHIELNAIDLACDIIARFTDQDLPDAFYNDWATVAGEEAKHFLLLSDRLADFGAAYGDLPAHDGLWEAAEETAHDLLARLAIVPLVLEARGLDVTPKMIARMTAFGDTETAAILKTIYQDEIGHVAIGKRWFDWACARRGLAPEDTWKALVKKHFRGVLKPPFNDEGRKAAGFETGWYAGV